MYTTSKIKIPSRKAAKPFLQNIQLKFHTADTGIQIPAPQHIKTHLQSFLSICLFQLAFKKSMRGLHRNSPSSNTKSTIMVLPIDKRKLSAPVLLNQSAAFDAIELYSSCFHWRDGISFLSYLILYI